MKAKNLERLDLGKKNKKQIRVNKNYIISSLQKLFVSR